MVDAEEIRRSRECVICLDELRDNLDPEIGTDNTATPSVTTPLLTQQSSRFEGCTCSTVAYHERCMQRWLRYQSVCPCCRAHIRWSWNGATRRMLDEFDAELYRDSEESNRDCYRYVASAVCTLIVLLLFWFIFWVHHALDLLHNKSARP